MNSSSNPGRTAGLWYLVLVILGPLRLLYIPSKLFVSGNAPATSANIAAHETLFRFGILTELLCAVVLIFLVLALYRLFRDVDRNLSIQVIILGGIMPSVLYFFNAVNDLAALSSVKDASFLAAFDQSQRDSFARMFLLLYDHTNTAAQILWGLWLIPLALLVYRSRFLPRFIGIWLFVNGLAYVAMSFTGVLAPVYQDKIFLYAQPAMFGEIVFMLWLVIKGAKPHTATSC